MCNIMHVMPKSGYSPYGFFSFDLPQLFGQGFPVFFDINLSADDVQSFYEYVQEGLYYDSNTRYGFEMSNGL
jgi:hypothetical protein